ncbi:DUF2007 domain-containing protein [Sinorhizobium meliloti]|nr:DUF2007 domain-containing protein [Sinorhizobium meliloti]
MKELIRTNDAVLLSFAESLMKDAGIGCFIADQDMSILEGSLGYCRGASWSPRDDANRARRILIDAGLELGIAAMIGCAPSASGKRHDGIRRR